MIGDEKEVCSLIRKQKQTEEMKKEKEKNREGRKKKRMERNGSQDRNVHWSKSKDRVIFMICFHLTMWLTDLLKNEKWWRCWYWWWWCWRWWIVIIIAVTKKLNKLHSELLKQKEKNYRLGDKSKILVVCENENLYSGYCLLYFKSFIYQNELNKFRF